MRDVLRRVGFEVRLAESGEHLITQLNDANTAGETPDLVITDIRMSGIDGLEVLRRIHGLSPTLPVILITAFGARETHERGAALGASVVLDKPFHPGALRRHVEALIGLPSA